MATDDKSKIIAYLAAVKNYEKGIKRLRKRVYTGNKAIERVAYLENLILGVSCGMDIDQCIRNCDGMYSIHSEGRALRLKRNQNGR